MKEVVGNVVRRKITMWNRVEIECSQIINKDTVIVTLTRNLSPIRS